jgi:hypothetical protein
MVGLKRLTESRPETTGFYLCLVEEEIGSRKVPLMITSNIAVDVAGKVYLPENVMWADFYPGTLEIYFIVKIGLFDERTHLSGHNEYAFKDLADAQKLFDICKDFIEKERGDNFQVIKFTKEFSEIWEKDYSNEILMALGEIMIYEGIDIEYPLEIVEMQKEERTLKTHW